MVTYGEWDFQKQKRPAPPPPVSIGPGDRGGSAGWNNGTTPAFEYRPPGTTTQVPQKRPPGQTPPIINIPPPPPMPGSNSGNTTMDYPRPPGPIQRPMGVPTGNNSGMYDQNGNPIGGTANPGMPPPPPMLPGAGTGPTYPAPAPIGSERPIIPDRYDRGPQTTGNTSGITYGEHNYPGGYGYKQGMNSPIGSEGGGGQMPSVYSQAPSGMILGVGSTPENPIWVPKPTVNAPHPQDPIGTYHDTSGITYGEHNYPGGYGYKQGMNSPIGSEGGGAAPMPQPSPVQWNPSTGSEGGGGQSMPSTPMPVNPLQTAATGYTPMASQATPAGNQYNPDTRPGQNDYNAILNAPLPPMPGTITDPFQQEAYRLRQEAWDKTRGMGITHMNANFQNQPETARQSYFAGLQSGKGIPVADTNQEYNRYRLRGITRR